MKVLVCSVATQLLICSVAWGETMKVGSYACTSRTFAGSVSEAQLGALVLARKAPGCKLVQKGAVVSGVKDEGDLVSFVVEGVRLYTPLAAFTTD